MACSRFVFCHSYGFQVLSIQVFSILYGFQCVIFFIAILADILIILVLKRPRKILKGNFKMCFEIFPKFLDYTHTLYLDKSQTGKSIKSKQSKIFPVSLNSKKNISRPLYFQLRKQSEKNYISGFEKQLCLIQQSFFLLSCSLKKHYY